MSKPRYVECFSALDLTAFLDLGWERFTPTRQEQFWSDEELSYTYGSGRGVRTYTSLPMPPVIREIMAELNREGKQYNVCLGNRYDDERQHLGWHADDFKGQDPNHPIAVVTFGAVREIWWRLKGFRGLVPPEQRQALASGSLFEMPAGFQETHEHKIPKHSQPCDTRISLTYRRIL